MNGMTEFWQGPFGSAYTTRNRVAWGNRIPFWRGVLDQSCARSVCEVGTNAGWNLSAIKYADQFVQTYGCEVNPVAHAQALRAGLRVELQDGETYLRGIDSEFDLVFTAGVLVHVAPDDLERTMKAIVNASANCVLAVEYDAPAEEEVEYRGHAGRLWKRPYGALYQQMGLSLVCKIDRPEGFDRCTAWMLRK